MPEPAELKAIVHDHQSGAREIGQRVLEILQRQATQSKADSPTGLMEELFDTALKVVRSKPEMAVVFNLVDRVFRALEAREESSDDVGEIRMDAVALLADELKVQETRFDAVATRAARRIANGNVIVTHSRSSTVLNAFQKAKAEGKLFDVVLTESRPLLEGRTLAKELANLQIPVRVVVDAAVHAVVPGADQVFIGSDAVTPDGVVNKIGTRSLAAAAHDSGVPVALLTESTKAWRRNSEPALGLGQAQTRDPKEVWDKAPAGVDVVNLTFDRTPKAMVTHVLDEETTGTFDAFWDRIRSTGYSRRVGQVFGDDLLASP